MDEILHRLISDCPANTNEQTSLLACFLVVLVFCFCSFLVGGCKKRFFFCNHTKGCEAKVSTMVSFRGDGLRA